MVERRTEDSIVRAQVRSEASALRTLLYGPPALPGSPVELGQALRAAVASCEAAWGGGGRVDLQLASDLGPVRGRPAQALAGAVGEALTNATTHGRAARVRVYVEPAAGGGLWCFVHDDGVGFDPARVPEGAGICRGIRVRLAEVGGQVHLRSRPGEGTEVAMWLP
jgi:signal transduction histidine kinase